MRRKGNQRSILASFLGVSLLLHLQVILIAIAILSANPEGCRSAPDLSLNPIEVALVDSESSVEQEQRIREQEIEKERQKEREEKGQVVEMAPPREERRPERAKYLSEYDSTVTHETKALSTGRPKRPAAQPRQRSIRTPEHHARPAPPAESERRLAMRSIPRVPRSRLAPDTDGDEVPSLEQSSAKRQRQNEAQRLDPAALRPTPRELSEAIGGGSLDALMGVEEGNETLLNSRRWRFASFFNRIKRQVAQNWHPDREYRRRDPAGNVYGFKDRLTILRVKLTPSGALKTMHLEKASGLAFLDNEAMNAFRLAQPFPNPPRGLVDVQTGLISFRFGFLFEISRRPNFRVLRFRN